MPHQQQHQFSHPFAIQQQGRRRTCSETGQCFGRHAVRLAGFHHVDNSQVHVPRFDTHLTDSLKEFTGVRAPEYQAVGLGHDSMKSVQLDLSRPMGQQVQLPPPPSPGARKHAHQSQRQRGDAESTKRVSAAGRPLDGEHGGPTGHPGEGQSQGKQRQRFVGLRRLCGLLKRQGCGARTHDVQGIAAVFARNASSMRRSPVLRVFTAAPCRERTRRSAHVNLHEGVDRRLICVRQAFASVRCRTLQWLERPSSSRKRLRGSGSLAVDAARQPDLPPVVRWVGRRRLAQARRSADQTGSVLCAPPYRTKRPTVRRSAT